MQTRVVCLICRLEVLGPQARGLRVDISGRPQVPVLQLLCYTSFSYDWLQYIYNILITFNCGFELRRLFYVFNTSTIILIYQQCEGTVFVGTTSCLHIVLSLYLVGDYIERSALFKT